MFHLIRSTPRNRRLVCHKRRGPQQAGLLGWKCRGPEQAGLLGAKPVFPQPANTLLNVRLGATMPTPIFLGEAVLTVDCKGHRSRGIFDPFRNDKE
jgi:hypothetical protein